MHCQVQKVQQQSVVETDSIVTFKRELDLIWKNKMQSTEERVGSLSKGQHRRVGQNSFFLTRKHRK